MSYREDEGACYDTQRNACHGALAVCVALNTGDGANDDGRTRHGDCCALRCRACTHQRPLPSSVSPRPTTLVPCTITALVGKAGPVLARRAPASEGTWAPTCGPTVAGLLGTGVLTVGALDVEDSSKVAMEDSSPREYSDVSAQLGRDTQSKA